MEGYTRRQLRKQLKLIPEQWALSQAILKNPQSCDEKRISLVSKAVGQVDLVAEQFKSAESLHLSSNVIRELTHIGQFSRLKSLSLAGNLIEEVAQLMPLKGLVRLENLNLEGNPVCVVPGYREFLVSKLPCLRSLDSREITPQEREKATLFTEKVEASEELAVVNEENVARLQHMLKVLKLHKQLIISRGLEAFPGVDVRLFLAYFRPTWPELLRHQVKVGLRAKVRSVVGERVDEASILAAYMDCLQTQQELIARISAACEDQAKTCKSLWTQPREKPKPKKPPTPLSRPTHPSRSSSFADSTGQRKDYSDVQTRYHNLIRPKRSNSSSRSNSTLKDTELEERPQQLRAPVQDLEKPRKWSEAEEETGKLAEQNRALREKLKEFEQANHDNVLMAESELRKLNERLQAAVAENERLKQREKEAAETIASLSAVHPQLEDRYSRLVYSDSSVHFADSEGLSLVVEKFRSAKLLQRAMRTLVQATERSYVIRTFTGEGQRRRETEVLMLCLAAWKWLAKTAKYVQFKTQQRAESHATAILRAWGRLAKQQQGRFALVTARKESLLRRTFCALADFPRGNQERKAEKRVADKMCEMHRLFACFRAWKHGVTNWNMSEFEESHLSRKANICNRVRLLRSVWTVWMRWRDEYGIPQRKSALVAYCHYATALRYRLLNLLISNLERSRQLTLSAHALARMRLRRTLVRCVKAFRKFLASRRDKESLEQRAVRFRLKSILRALRSALQSEREKHRKEESAVSHYFKSLLRSILRAYQRLTSKRKLLASNAEGLMQSQKTRQIRRVVSQWLVALWREADHRVNNRARRIFRSWSRFALMSRMKKRKAVLGSRLYVTHFQMRLRGILHSWAGIHAKRLSVRVRSDTLGKTGTQRLLSRSFSFWRDAYARAIFSRVKVNMTTLAQTESSLTEQSVKVRELGDTNAALRLQLSQTEARLKEALEARSALETQLRSIQENDNEAAVLISKLERDFSAASATIRQLQREKETLIRNSEAQVQTLRDELKERERELAAAEQELIRAADFRKDVAESTDEHVLEVVNTSDQLLAQLQAKEKDLAVALRQNEVLVEKLRESEARVTELEEDRLQTPSERSPPCRQQKLVSFLDSEPVRLPLSDEDQIQEQLLTLKQERAAIREEIESRMKRVDGRQRIASSRTPSDSGLLDISTRMASLEARLASKLK